MRNDIVDVFKINGFCVRESPDKFEAFVDMVDRDHATRAEKPGALHSERSDRSGAKDHDRLAFFNFSHLGRLIPGRKNVAEEKNVLVLHIVRNFHWSHVRKRYANKFRLAS